MHIRGKLFNRSVNGKVNIMKEKSSQKKTARLAGLLYLLIIISSLYGHLYVPFRLFVKDDAVATAQNILNNELLFRTCVVAGLVEAQAILFLALSLYRLFREVSSHHSRIMLTLAAIQVPIAFVLAIFKLSALMLLKDEAGIADSATQSAGMAMLFLQITRMGSVVSGVLAGLWILPLGLLVIQSRFIPRIIGMSLLIAGSGYIIAGLVSILAPDDAILAQVLAFISFGLAEIPMMLWLLMMGVRDHISLEILSETRTGTSPADLNPVIDI